MPPKDTSKAATIPQTKNIVLGVSFENDNDEALFRRLVRYAKANGLGKPQNAVRLAVAKFLQSEGF